MDFNGGRRWVVERWTSNPKTLSSTPWRSRVRTSVSVPPSQLLCKPVCVWLPFVSRVQHAPKFVRTLKITLCICCKKSWPPGGWYANTHKYANVLLYECEGSRGMLFDGVPPMKERRRRDLWNRHYNTRTRAHTHTHTHKYARTHPYTHNHTHTHKYTHACAHTRARTYRTHAGARGGTRLESFSLPQGSSTRYFRSSITLSWRGERVERY